MRSLNCSSRREQLLLRSTHRPTCHEVHWLSSHHRPLHKRGLHGKLCRRKVKCLSRQAALIHPRLHTAHDPAGSAPPNTQRCPYPLPCRTSSGLPVMGLSGKSRIQIFPPRLMWRVMARRAASIWRAVMRPRPVAFKGIFAKAHLAPTLSETAVAALSASCGTWSVSVATCSTSSIRYLQLQDVGTQASSPSPITSPLKIHTFTPITP